MQFQGRSEIEISQLSDVYLRQPKTRGVCVRGLPFGGVYKKVS